MREKDPKISLKTLFGWGEMKSFLNKMYNYTPQWDLFPFNVPFQL